MRFHSSTEQQNEEFHPTSCPISCQSLEPYWKLMLSLPALDSTKNSLNSTSSENAHHCQKRLLHAAGFWWPGAEARRWRRWRPLIGKPLGFPIPHSRNSGVMSEKWGMSVWWNCACIQLFRILMFFISYLGTRLGDSGCVYRKYTYISYVILDASDILQIGMQALPPSGSKLNKIALCTYWCDCFAKTS